MLVCSFARRRVAKGERHVVPRLTLVDLLNGEQEHFSSGEGFLSFLVAFFEKLSSRDEADQLRENNVTFHE